MRPFTVVVEDGYYFTCQWPADANALADYVEREYGFIPLLIIHGFASIVWGTSMEIPDPFTTPEEDD